MPDTTTTFQEDNSTTIAAELDCYLEAACVPIKTNPMNFWKDNCKRYPYLSIIAKKVLSVSASSAPVEWLFSVAGKVFKPEHCRLTGRKFEELIFIWCNNSVN